MFASSFPAERIFSNIQYNDRPTCHSFSREGPNIHSTCSSYVQLCIILIDLLNVGKIKKVILFYESTGLFRFGGRIFLRFFFFSLLLLIIIRNGLTCGRFHFEYYVVATECIGRLACRRSCLGWRWLRTNRFLRIDLQLVLIPCKRWILVIRPTTAR